MTTAQSKIQQAGKLATHDKQDQTAIAKLEFELAALDTNYTTVTGDHESEPGEIIKRQDVIEKQRVRVTSAVRYLPGACAESPD